VTLKQLIAAGGAGTPVAVVGPEPDAARPGPVPSAPAQIPDDRREVSLHAAPAATGLIYGRTIRSGSTIASMPMTGGSASRWRG